MRGLTEKLIPPESSLIRNSPLSDEEVVIRVRNGDTALYEIIMRRYNQRLSRIARSIVRDESEAEDIMQEAYVLAYASLDQFAGLAKFSTWLVKITVHEAFSRLRRRQRFSEVRADVNPRFQVVDALRCSAPDLEQQALQLETVSLLEHAVHCLPDMYRSVFVLRAIEGMSTAEAAGCLSVSQEAVKIRLLRARRILRLELYKQVRATNLNAFRFMGERCDRVVEKVWCRLESARNAERHQAPAWQQRRSNSPTRPRGMEAATFLSQSDRRY